MTHARTDVGGSTIPAVIIGLALVAATAVLGSLLGAAALDYREYERTVTVKGLSERELPADVVIWPIGFVEAGNDLGELYAAIDADKTRIRDFLVERGIEPGEISFALPAITDKSAQQYGGPEATFRYSGTQTVTVYSTHIDRVRAAMNELVELGRGGIVFTGDNYANQTEYLFTRLNDIKPEMIEEATAQARQVAEKFAADSNSRLGKIRSASQGQFSITPRDQNNPHLKKIRVVSTVRYYLAD